MPKKIITTLDSSQLKKAAKELRDYASWFRRKTAELNERLAIIGTAEAARRFGGAIYDGDNDVSLSAIQTDKGWTIRAEGKAVAFIEFGAGRFFNSGEPYPNPRPPGIVGIGEYGQGKGKGQGWVFFDESGSKVFTRGNPASMPMWYATERIRQDIVKIAKEVFASG